MFPTDISECEPIKLVPYNMGNIPIKKQSNTAIPTPIKICSHNLFLLGNNFFCCPVRNIAVTATAVKATIISKLTHNLAAYVSSILIAHIKKVIPTIRIKEMINIITEYILSEFTGNNVFLLFSFSIVLLAKLPFIALFEQTHYNISTNNLQP